MNTGNNYLFPIDSANKAENGHDISKVRAIMNNYMLQISRYQLKHPLTSHKDCDFGLDMTVSRPNTLQKVNQSTKKD
jgi:hypothetical protein